MANRLMILAMGGSHREPNPQDRFKVDVLSNRRVHPPLGEPNAFAVAATLRFILSIPFALALVIFITVPAFAADLSSPNSGAFRKVGDNEFSFDTSVLRGKLHADGKAMGLTNVVHIPSGKRLDASAGIMSFYRVFTANKRYGTAAWDWPKCRVDQMADGSVRYAWYDLDEPFGFTVVYRWMNATTLDVAVTVFAVVDELKGFESFLASYFAKDFATPAAYVAQLPDTGKPGFLIAKKDAGDWQMFPRDEKSVPLIKDGRWTIEPNPVDWMIRPTLAAPLCVRRDMAGKLAMIVMAPPQDCFAVAMPYEGEQHYSMYLSLFGQDLKFDKRTTARARFIVAESITDAEIVERYQEYMKQIPRLNSGIEM